MAVMLLSFAVQAPVQAGNLNSGSGSDGTLQTGTWKPAGNRIMTSWGENLNPDNVLPEYPRPQMVRSEWLNLNGLWNYAIRPSGEIPSSWDGEILVPFAAESALSGVGKTVGKSKELWYERTFEVPAKWSGKRVLLHFGAVDWKADVYVNGVSVGGHEGGYAPFSFDITPALNKKGANTLRVKVWDPTDEGYQPRGKQVRKSSGIWYTPVTGIWQTVWLEPVAKSHISNMCTTPDLDRKSFRINASVDGGEVGDIIGVKVFEGDALDQSVFEKPGANEGNSITGKPLPKGRLVAEYKALSGVVVDAGISSPQIWSPEHPYLYNLEISLIRDGKVIDKVTSYAAMRKVSVGMDVKGKSGIKRLTLNDLPLFQMGPLDQGWWPDGLYTAPTDEALAYDVVKLKEYGFNMIRKHIKVEPARWYWDCDRLGMLVWQDMPSGDMSDKMPAWQAHQYFTGEEKTRSAASEQAYRKEWKEIMDCLKGFPCICVWVPFNEAWGQFKTVEISEWTKAYDPSRLVNAASGGNFYRTGDILDLHNYPAPLMYMVDKSRVTVLGEYGGIGMVVKDHIWEPDRNWGYIEFGSSKEVTDEYVKYAQQLLDLVKAGFSAGVYTQTTDVEIEVNGLMTYDRKVEKVEAARVREINQKLVHSLDK